MFLDFIVFSALLIFVIFPNDPSPPLKEFSLSCDPNCLSEEYAPMMYKKYSNSPY